MDYLVHPKQPPKPQNHNCQNVYRIYLKKPSSGVRSPWYFSRTTYARTVKKSLFKTSRIAVPRFEPMYNFLQIE